MKEKHIQISGIVIIAVFSGLIVWLYAVEPKSLGDVSIKARTSVETIASKTEVAVGAYEVDEAKFGEGLKRFRANDFASARDFFERADPEKRDARTQFYIAYSFYREGFGKLYSDDALFKKGLEQTDVVVALDKDFQSNDADLKMKTADELRREFEEGLKITAGDFNPLKVLRERK